jgi:hypothetical protein
VDPLNKEAFSAIINKLPLLEDSSVVLTPKPPLKEDPFSATSYPSSKLVD